MLNCWAHFLYIHGFIKSTEKDSHSSYEGLHSTNPTEGYHMNHSKIQISHIWKYIFKYLHLRPPIAWFDDQFVERKHNRITLKMIYSSMTTSSYSRGLLYLTITLVYVFMYLTQTKILMTRYLMMTSVLLGSCIFRKWK